MNNLKSQTFSSKMSPSKIENKRERISEKIKKKSERKTFMSPKKILILNKIKNKSYTSPTNCIRSSPKREKIRKKMIFLNKIQNKSHVSPRMSPKKEIIRKKLIEKSKK